MPLGRFDRKLGAAALAAFSLALAAAPGDARAAGPVSPVGKGIVGGALLGGEVVTITMAAAGVERGWPYFVFGAVGAAGGGIGGFFVEKATKGTVAANGSVTGRTSEPALYMLAGGMALLIPALVLSLNATAYKPPESDRVEPVNNKPKDGPPPKASKVQGPRTVAEMPHIPVSLLDMYKGRFGVGLPALELRPLYTQTELAQYGVAQGTEARIPVFKATF